MAEAVLDVVPEDPQVEHVADEMEPAGVEEHAREDAQHRVGCEPALLERTAELGRNDTVVEEERIQALLPGARLDPQLIGEDDERQPQKEERDEGSAAGRVRVAERDHGAGAPAGAAEGATDAGTAGGEVPGLALGSVDGAGEAVEADCVSSAWYSRFPSIQTMVAGASSTPGTTYMPRTSVHVIASPVRRYCSMYSPVSLSMAMTREFGWS